MTIHLFHLYRRPQTFAGVTIGFSLCGQRLPREQLTKFKDDTECEKCRSLIADLGAEPAEVIEITQE